MPKPKLVLVHGMGQHTADSFSTEFRDAIHAAFNLYPNLENKSADEYVEIVPLSYNDIFDEYREIMADRSKSILPRLNELPNNGYNISEAAEKISEIESTIDDDSFFKSHWLDVIFYRFTILGEKVRIRVAKNIVDAIARVEGGAQNVHILAHSLGTSVLHDALSKTYNPNYVLGDEGSLSFSMHKLGSLHFIANTSKVLQSFSPVHKSIVKPGGNGCTFRYSEYRHALDPITWPAQFNPTDNGGWISNNSWYLKRYKLLRLTSVTSQSGNTHNLEHYILNPLTHLNLFKEVFDINLSEEQIAQGHQNYISKTLSSVSEDLQEALTPLKKMNIENVSGLITAAKKLQQFISAKGEVF